jgi:ABC-type dipeptide/oligopeptide/nickel transport system permease component
VRGIAYYFASILLVFSFIRELVWRLPGSIADLISDSETNLQDLKTITSSHGQQESFFSQLFNFFTLNWGSSLAYKEKNLNIIWKHLHLTLYLSILSLLISFLFVFLMFYQDKKKMRKFSNFFLSLPALAVFPLFVWVFCEFTSYCPAGSENIKTMVLLAAFAQALLVAPRFFRELDAEVDHVLRQRFILILRAKGLSKKRILWMHVLTNVFPAFLSLILLTWLGFISGSILVEALFDLPGIGALTLEALRGRDLPLVYSLLLLLGVFHLSSLRMSSLLKRRVDV